MEIEWSGRAVPRSARAVHQGDDEEFPHILIRESALHTYYLTLSVASLALAGLVLAQREMEKRRSPLV
jgi:hypothetical protein